MNHAQPTAKYIALILRASCTRRARLVSGSPARPLTVSSPPPPRRCRVCGCTDDNCSQCVEQTGEPCHWVSPTLCSACIPVTHRRLPCVASGRSTGRRSA